MRNTQVTHFVAWFSLDQQRQLAHRDGCLCCYTHKGFEVQTVLLTLLTFSILILFSFLLFCTICLYPISSPFHSFIFLRLSTCLMSSFSDLLIFLFLWTLLYFSYSMHLLYS